MPFVCKYCGGSFCPEHRLPESHECPGLKQVKGRVARGEMPMFIHKKAANEIKVNFDYSPPGPGNSMREIWKRIKKFFGRPAN